MLMMFDSLFLMLILFFMYVLLRLLRFGLSSSGNVDVLFIFSVICGVLKVLKLS